MREKRLRDIEKKLAKWDWFQSLTCLMYTNYFPSVNEIDERKLIWNRM